MWNIQNRWVWERTGGLEKRRHFFDYSAEPDTYFRWYSSAGDILNFFPWKSSWWETGGKHKEKRIIITKARKLESTKLVKFLDPGGIGFAFHGAGAINRPALARLDCKLLVESVESQDRKLETRTMFFSVWARDPPDISSSKQWRKDCLAYREKAAKEKWTCSLFLQRPTPNVQDSQSWTPATREC